MATRYAERLREAAASIRNDGTPAQVGLSAEECDEIAAAITALEAALKPFARYAELDSGQNDRIGIVGVSSPEGSIDVTYGDFRRAREALASIESKP